MTLRKLTPAEVEFSYELEPEQYFSVEGYFDSGEPEQDRKVEQQIVDAINWGFVEAWCTLIVKAKWHHWEGITVLGCCNFPVGLASEKLDEVVKQHIQDHGMNDEALGLLQKGLESQFSLLTQLKV